MGVIKIFCRSRRRRCMGISSKMLAALGIRSTIILGEGMCEKIRSVKERSHLAHKFALLRTRLSTSDLGTASISSTCFMS